MANENATYVYTVNQTQFNGCDYEYQDIVVHIVSTQDEAVRRARLLNQEYGEGCEFDDDYDFVDVDESAACFHYYTTKCFKLDEKMPYEEFMGNKDNK